MKNEKALATGLAVLTMGISAGNMMPPNKKQEPMIANQAKTEYFVAVNQNDRGQKNQKVIKNPSFSDFEKFISAHKYVVVEVGAASCEPCRIFEERVDGILSKDARAGDLSFVFVDAFDKADGTKIASRYGLTAHVPHVFLIINGKIDWSNEKIKPITPPIDGITSQEEFDAVLFKSAGRFFDWINGEKKNREK